MTRKLLQLHRRFRYQSLEADIAYTVLGNPDQLNYSGTIQIFLIILELKSQWKAIVPPCFTCWVLSHSGVCFGRVFCCFNFFSSLSKNKIQTNNLKGKSFDVLESKPPEVALLRMWHYKLFQALKREDTVKDRIPPAATISTSWLLSQVYGSTVTPSVTILQFRSCQREEQA